MLPTYDDDNGDDDGDDPWGHHEEVPDLDDASAPVTQSAQELRQMANSCFANRDFDSALPLYSMAIEALLKDQEKNINDVDIDVDMEMMIVFLCNRSTCLHRMELYEDARNDAQEALRLSDPSPNAKAAFRCAKAQLMLKEYKDAIGVLSGTISKLEIKLQNEKNTCKGKDNDNDNDNDSGNENENENENENAIRKEMEELTKLIQTAHAHNLASKNIPNAKTLAKITSLKHRGVASGLTTTTTSNKNNNNDNAAIHNKEEVVAYIPTIREFDMIENGDLGDGNYSHVVIVKHAVTQETFALKMIPKKKVESLAKREHPNVYNEIEMEKKVLGLRLYQKDYDSNSNTNSNDEKNEEKEEKNDLGREVDALSICIIPFRIIIICII